MPKRIIYSYIKILKEAAVRKKKFLLRYEIPHKGLPQYCIRDSKFNEIFKASRKLMAEELFAEYIKALENPHNPFKSDDIIYEKRGEAKDDYDFYRVEKTTKMTVYLRKILTENFTSVITGNSYMTPLKTKFADEKTISKKVELLVTGEYLAKAAYGIRSERGIYARLESVSVIYKDKE